MSSSGEAGEERNPTIKEEKTTLSLGFVRRLIVFAVALIIFPFLVLTAWYAASDIIPVLTPLNPFKPFAHNTTGVPTYFTPTRANTQSLFTNTLFQSPTSSQQGFVFPIPQIPFVTIWEFLLIVILIASSIGVAFRATKKQRLRSFSYNEDETRKDREQVARVLDAAVFQLRQGSSYRDAVLECYREISEILEEKLALKGEMFTAREFEEIVSRILKLDSPYLSEVTGLFEVARYSQIEVTKIEADHASKCLSNLSNLLKKDDLKR